MVPFNECVKFPLSSSLTVKLITGALQGSATMTSVDSTSSPHSFLAVILISCFPEVSL